VDSGRTLRERDRDYGMPELLKKFAAGGACRPHLGSVWSRALAAARPVTRACLARLLQILALVSDFQFELPPLKAHQHAAELLPGDLSTIDV
jgi:hypothetical protein